MQTSELLQKLENINALRFGEFTLASGDTSSFYLDLRYIPAYPNLFKSLIKEIHNKITSSLNYDLIIGIPSAGTPFATALALEEDKPQQLLRKKPKKHGMGKQIEGPNIEGKRVLLIDDLISSGYSKEFAIKVIRENNAVVEDLVVLIDRSEGKAKEWSKGFDVNLYSLFELHGSDILEYKKA